MKLFVALIAAQGMAQVQPQWFAGRNLTEPITDPLTMSIGVPGGVAADGEGNLYVSSRTRNFIYRIAPSRQVSIYGSGARHLRTDGDGNLYFVDRNQVKMIERGTRNVVLIAGTGEASFTGNGGFPATQSAINDPRGIDVDDEGNAYITGYNNNRVMRVDKATGILRVIAGTGELRSSSGPDGVPATQSIVHYPSDVKVAPNGDVYIVDDNGTRVRRIGSDGIIRTVAGGGLTLPTVDGQVALQTRFTDRAVIYWIAFDPAGNLVLGLFKAVWRVRNGLLERVVGSVWDDRTYQDNVWAQLSWGGGYSGIYDNAGNLLLADIFNLRRVRAADQVIETVFGNWDSNYCGDNDAKLTCLMPYEAVWAGDRLVVFHRGLFTYPSRVVQITGDGLASSLLRDERLTTGRGITASRKYIYVQDRRISIADGKVEQIPVPASRVTADDQDTLYYTHTTYSPGPVIELLRYRAGVVTSLAPSIPSQELFWLAGALYVQTANALYRVNQADGTYSRYYSGFVPGILTADAAGNIYFPDSVPGALVIRKLTGPDQVTTVASFPTGSPVTMISGLAAAPDGTLFISDTQSGKIFTLGANPCFYSIARESLALASFGDIGRLSVGTAAGCPWSVTSDAPWLTVTSAAANVGAGEVRFVAGANTAETPRSASLTIAGQRLTVTQGGTACTYSVAPPNASLPAVGGTVSLYVSASGANCPWTVGTPSWMNAGVDPTGVGTQAIALIAGANANPRPRLGYVNAAGFLVPVIQRGTDPTQPFADVPFTHPFADYINTVKDFAIRENCTPGNYCPNVGMNRGEVAALLVRMLYGGDTFDSPAIQVFDDVSPSHTYFHHVQKLHELGITTGCTAIQFCPGDPVTRGQMAALIVRSLFAATLTVSSYPFPPTPAFGDVATSNVFFQPIQKLMQLGITSGCTATQYCPNDTINRGQMAVFLVRGLSK